MASLHIGSVKGTVNAAKKIIINHAGGSSEDPPTSPATQSPTQTARIDEQVQEEPLFSPTPTYDGLVDHNQGSFPMQPGHEDDLRAPVPISSLSDEGNTGILQHEDNVYFGATNGPSTDFISAGRNMDSGIQSPREGDTEARSSSLIDLRSHSMSLRPLPRSSSDIVTDGPGMTRRLGNSNSLTQATLLHFKAYDEDAVLTVESPENSLSSPRNLNGSTEGHQGLQRHHELAAYAGGRSDPVNDDIFVVINKNMLVQDDADPNVSVVEVLPCFQVLDKLQTSGLPDESSQLMLIKWKGHRDFELSLWKLTLKPEIQLQNLLQSLHDLFRDKNVQCIRNVLKLLKTNYDIFFHSMSWDKGLFIYLGHANSKLRNDFLQSPLKEEIKHALLQLFPDGVQNLFFCEEPLACSEKDMEFLGQPQMCENKRCPYSFSSEDLFRSGPNNLCSEDHENTGNSRQSRPVQGSFNGPYNSTSVSSLVDSLENFFQESCSNYMKQQPLLQESFKQVQQQWQSQLNDLSDSHTTKTGDLEHAVKTLMQEKELMSQKLSDLDTQVQEQNKTLKQILKRISDMVEVQQMMKDNQENWKSSFAKQIEQRQQTFMELIESKDKEHQLEMKKMEEKMLSQQQFVKEMNKQRKDMEMMQTNNRWQEEQHAELRETVTRLLKLYQETEKRFRCSQGASPSDIPGQPAREEDLQGAVGGNTFSIALAESEQATTKMKGKEEQISSNQLEEGIRLPPMMHAVLDQEEQENALACGMTAIPEEGSVLTRDTDPNFDISSSAKVSAQNGARSKNQKPVQDNPGKEKESPQRKLQSSTESSQERTEPAPPDINSADLLKAEQFLDWISIYTKWDGSKDVTKIISRHVGAALKEEEKPSPRAKCLDTILCLDISDSIIQDGKLDMVKNTALEFVNGIEDQMEDTNLEENIAVIAMGGNARVVQHLTNDLTLVREAIESLDKSGGRSPFMQALMVCMAANKGRGGVLNVSGVHRVRPRIIFITDGFPTDEEHENGPDSRTVCNQASFPLVQLLAQLASKQHKSTPRPIIWVSVGSAKNDTFLKSLADLTGGELLKPEEIRQLCPYYHMQQTIGRLLKMVKKYDKEEMPDSKMKELLDAMIAETLTAEEKAMVVEKVKYMLLNPEDPEKLEADDFDNVFENEEKVKSGKLLALGTRVVRGPDWRWKNQDTDGPGTVIQHDTKDNWIFVKWDNGMYNAYRYGEAGYSDVVETQHHPRQIAQDSTKLTFGVRVVRGPDWKSGNQDCAGPGTVIRCRDSDGKVKVRWDKTGKIYEYYYSVKSGKEVQIHVPEFPRKTLSSTNDDTENTDSKTIPIWKWRDELGQWRLYDQENCQKLETEYKKRPSGSCIIDRAGNSRRVVFKQMLEKLVDGSVQTEICREMVDEERRNDLLAIEFVLNSP